MGDTHRICVICEVNERHSSEKLFFARFPLHENRCKEWVKVVGKEDLVHLPIEKLHGLRHVCGKHFEKRDFTKSKTKLKKRAIPKLHLRFPPLPDALLEGFPLHIARTQPVLIPVEAELLKQLPSTSMQTGIMTLTNTGGGEEKSTLKEATPKQKRKPPITILEVRKSLPESTVDPAVIKDTHQRLQTLSQAAVDPRSIQIKANKALVSTISKVEEVTEGVKVDQEVGSTSTTSIPRTDVYTEEVSENAVITEEVTDEYIEHEYAEAEETPFSWQQDVAVVPCDDLDTDCDTKVDDIYLFPASEKPCDDTKVTSAEKDEAAQSKHERFKCNICFSEIIGFRYACVQCLDWDLCGACEARRAHPHHYVLRVPEGRPPGEVRARLQTLRRALHDAIVTVAAPGDDVEIKEEEDDPMDVETLETSVPASSEPNPTGDMTPLRAVRTSGSHGTKTESSDDDDYNDDDDSYKPSSGSSDDESQTSGPASFPGTDPPQQEPATTAPLSKIEFSVVTRPTEISECFSLEVEKVDPESCLPPPTKTRVIDIRDLPQSVRERLRVQVVSAARVQSERSVGRVVLYPARRAVRAPYPPHPHPHPHTQQALHRQAFVRLQRLTSAEINAALRNS